MDVDVLFESICVFQGFKDDVRLLPVVMGQASRFFVLKECDS
jgi:hypothetical protein